MLEGILSEERTFVVEKEEEKVEISTTYVGSETLQIRKTAPWASACPRAKVEVLNNQLLADALFFY